MTKGHQVGGESSPSTEAMESEPVPSPDTGSAELQEGTVAEGDLVGDIDHLQSEPAPSPDTGSAELQEGAIAEGDCAGEIDHLQSEFDALNDRHLRLAAEFTNFRRRAEHEMTEAWGRAQADFLRRFLDVLDDLQRVSALDPSDEAVSLQTVVDGIDLVERKFARALADASVESVDPAPGDPFDPATMEAVTLVPSALPEDDDTVDQVCQKGYRFRSHLVRAARVSVRKHE